MPRRAGYEESWDLTYLVEQLRELISLDFPWDDTLSHELEGALTRLVTRHQQLHGLLHQLATTTDPSEELEVLHEDLEHTDHELLTTLPGLLEKLRDVLR
ncbi:hypothetical protein MYSTI_00019 [Myxococcus stipitatus DSM 14675]|uniref:Uncharacterized protein n=1 Tax=Myxococcus stipitatus (strain DSM 14675 / JCM 12634 / Mx s8) TaxID=1278073 RepID=L7TZF0_MYXSD|nr:hypothetical protein [Myxococcus stipitatus]AGC41378.1 hypothetical protein MYSTI_00019 [Myxococcus stipitatus DSM 14675]